MASSELGICGVCQWPRKGMAGPDPCWGLLPGVKAACCGHGVRNGYISFENGITIDFHTAVIRGGAWSTDRLPNGQLFVLTGNCGLANPGV